MKEELEHLRKALGLDALPATSGLERVLERLHSGKGLGTVGIFGGSFNPPHKAHIELVRALASQERFECIVLIPAFCSPFKTRDALVSDTHRFEMCKRAFEGIPRVFLSTLELDRASTSYMVDTLTEISQALPPRVQLSLILGRDAFEGLDRWKESKRVQSLARLVVVERFDGNEIEGVASFFAKASNQDDELLMCSARADIEEYISLDLPSIASTELRSMLSLRDRPAFKHEQLLREYIPSRVLEYIVENRLYIQD